MRSWWIKAQAALGAGVLAAGVGAAVVGSGGGGVTLAGPQVLRLLQSAPAALNSYPSVHMAMRMTVQAGARTVSMTETGLTAPDGSVGTLHANLPLNQGAFDVITVNHTLYGKVRGNGLTETGGKHWVALTLTNLPATTGFQSGTDALSYFKLLPGATGPVTTVGHERIAGVRTTHYRVTIDLAKAMQKLPPQLQQPGAADQLRMAGITTMPVDVWIDGARFVRQTGMRMTIHGITVAMTMTLRGSNSRLKVDPPAAGDIYPTDNITDFARLAIGM